MDSDLIKSIISVIVAFIPLAIAILALIQSKASNITKLNDSPEIKILKIKREPVDEKYWIEFRRNQFITYIMWGLPSVTIYTAVLFYGVRQIKNSFAVLTITLILGATLVWVSNLINRTLSHNYILAIRDAYNGRYFLFKDISIELEADYYYIFNKSQEVLKSEGYPIIEVDTTNRIIEACFSHHHFYNLNETGLIKVTLHQRSEDNSIFIVSIDVVMSSTMHPLTKLATSSKLANRFVNELISRPEGINKKAKDK